MDSKTPESEIPVLKGKTMFMEAVIDIVLRSR